MIKVNKQLTCILLTVGMLTTAVLRMSMATERLLSPISAPVAMFFTFFPWTPSLFVG